MGSLRPAKGRGMKTLIKVCALGVAFVAGVVVGQSLQVQATPKAVTAGPIETVSSLAKHTRETVRWEQGTYRARYVIAEITAYCPLDPKAVKGMDYLGDRTIGANGKKVVSGLTAAAPKAIPFGTEMLIEGFGRRVVSDRGSRIVEKGEVVCIDLCVWTRSEARKIGRRRVPMMIFEEENND